MALQNRPMLILPEDTWVPHFHALCEGAIASAQRLNTYVALDAGEEWPHKEANRQALLSIDGLAVLAGEYPAEFQAMLAERIEGWMSNIAVGAIGPVLSEVESLPASLNVIKPLLRIQVLHKGGLYALVADALRTEPEILSNLDSTTAVQMAEMAADADANDISARLLGQVSFESLPQEVLHGALNLAKRIDDKTSLAECERCLTELYPSSEVLRRYRANKLQADSDYEELSRLMGASPLDADRQLAPLYAALARALASPPVDWLRLAEDLVVAFPAEASRAKAIVSREAAKAGQYAAALSVVVPTQREAVAASGPTNAILNALEQLLLTRDEENELAIDEELSREGIAYVIQYLSQHPKDAGLRMRLADLLSAQSMGLLGLAFVAQAAVTFVKGPLQLRNVRSLDEWTKAPPPADIFGFMKGALPWLHSAAPIFIGRTVIPEALLTLPADSLIAGIERVLEEFPLDEPTDIEAIQQFLAIGTSVSPHSSDPDSDLSLVRIVAVRLALATKYQRARDIAEHALQMAEDSPRRARLGWLCYGDVYERTGDTIEGLIGAACCLAADSEATPEQVYYEAILLFRLMRDLQLFDLAIAFLEAAHQALDRFDALDHHGHRIHTLELQARLLQVLQDPRGNAGKLAALVDALTLNAQDVLARHDEPAPAAAALGEALRLTDLVGVSPPSNAEDVFSSLLNECKPPLKSLISTVRLLSPSAEQVLAVVAQLEQARYVSDAAFDIRQLVTLSRRLLAGEDALANPHVAAFAIELETDHAIAVPDIGGAQPSWLPKKIDAAGDLAVEVSKSTDLPIVLLGVGSDDLLVRVTATGDGVERAVRESPDVFSERRLRQWSRKFPFDYGVLETTPVTGSRGRSPPKVPAYNLFHTSTEGLGVDTLPSRAVLITGANLQHWPPNLIRIGDNFAGQTMRLASAPSIRWLDAARKKIIADRRAIAWISTETSESGGETLQSIVDRLSESLDTYGVALDTRSEIPDNLQNAELAIVAAHGSLVPGGRYFQVVRNDAAFKVAASKLSNALSGVGVAILFVCSGGRLDPHPMANTTIGLARQILENGCTAVIASPWPVDSRMPSYWLPAFLKSWNAGLPIIDATFEANLHVRDFFSSELRDCLAMNVYGDPLRAKAI